MSHEVEILLALFVVFVSAKVGAEIAQRLKMPGVVGEIAAGCLIGPSVLDLIHIDAPLQVLAEIGAVLLLFSVGLETRLLKPIEALLMPFGLKCDIERAPHERGLA